MGICNLDIDDYAFAICRGGWPEAVTEQDDHIALSMAGNYVRELLERDIEEMDEKSRNSTWMRAAQVVCTQHLIRSRRDDNSRRLECGWLGVRVIIVCDAGFRRLPAVKQEGAMMDFNDLSPELPEKAKNCKTPEEVLALAREEGYELSEEELEAISGGWFMECKNFKIECASVKSPRW